MKVKLIKTLINASALALSLRPSVILRLRSLSDFFFINYVWTKCQRTRARNTKMTCVCVCESEFVESGTRMCRLSNALQRQTQLWILSLNKKNERTNKQTNEQTKKHGTPQPSHPPQKNQQKQQQQNNKNNTEN